MAAGLGNREPRLVSARQPADSRVLNMQIPGSWTPGPRLEDPESRTRHNSRVPGGDPVVTNPKSEIRVTFPDTRLKNCCTIDSDGR